LLVIRLGALGDVANTLRAVAALRKSLAPVRIGWLVEERSRDLVASARVADEVILFPRKRLAHLLKRPWRWPGVATEALGFLQRLRALNYAVALDFQGNLKSGILGLLSGARDRFGFARGFCKEMNWAFNNAWVVPSSRRLPRAQKFAALAQVLDPDLEPAAVSLSENQQAQEHVDGLLSGVRGDGPLVVLHPGTSAFGRFKRWPAARFGELAAGLRDRMGARCVVTRGPDEGELASEVAAASSGAAHPVPFLPLDRLIELLRRAALIVAGDTGPLHIAALLERPVVAIFGPKDPVVYGPFGTRSEIVRVELECSPCTRRKCNHARCVMEIETAQVIEAAERMLGTDEPALP